MHYNAYFPSIKVSSHILVHSCTVIPIQVLMFPSQLALGFPLGLVLSTFNPQNCFGCPKLPPWDSIHGSRNTHLQYWFGPLKYPPPPFLQYLATKPSFYNFRPWGKQFSAEKHVPYHFIRLHSELNFVVAIFSALCERMVDLLQSLCSLLRLQILDSLQVGHCVFVNALGKLCQNLRWIN